MRIEDYLRVAKRVDLDDTAALVDALAANRDDPEALADVSRAHHVIRSVRCALDDKEGLDQLPPDLLAAVDSRRRSRRVAVATLLDTFDEVHRELARAGIPALLLKGLYFGQRLYGGLDQRPQFDVDVLVRPRQFRQAIRMLRQRGFAREAYDLHSQTLVRRKVKVDLHRSLRSAPAYRLDEEQLWAQAQEVVITGRRVPTLADEHTLVMLILSSFEDLGQGAARLKQLLDFYLFLREVEGTIDWQGFLDHRQRENLLAVSVNVLSLIVELFEARGAFPRLDAALRPHAHRVDHQDREAALALLAAPRKAPASLAWFARVYPGSMLHYLAWFWVGGFPDNLRHLGRPWFLQGLRRALATPRPP